MLLFGERLLKNPVMSLRVGAKIAETVYPVIDPRTLSILAYEVEGPMLDERPSYIRIADVRELSDLGMIIDDASELVGADDIIKLKELLALNFSLIGMKVVTTRGKKLGKVEDYTVDTDSFVIQQLSVRASLIGSLSSTGHMIHRSQITEVSDSIITVENADNALPTLETEGNIHRTYTNPFRKSNDPQPDTTQTN